MGGVCVQRLLFRRGVLAHGGGVVRPGGTAAQATGRAASARASVGTAPRTFRAAHRSSSTAARMCGVRRPNAVCGADTFQLAVRSGFPLDLLGAALAHASCGQAPPEALTTNRPTTPQVLSECPAVCMCSPSTLQRTCSSASCGLQHSTRGLSPDQSRTGAVCCLVFVGAHAAGACAASSRAPAPVFRGAAGNRSTAPVSASLP